jgi:hypothetical protein
MIFNDIHNVDLLYYLKSFKCRSTQKKGEMIRINDFCFMRRNLQSIEPSKKNIKFIYLFIFDMLTQEK